MCHGTGSSMGSAISVAEQQAKSFVKEGGNKRKLVSAQTFAEQTERFANNDHWHAVVTLVYEDRESTI